MEKPSDALSAARAIGAIRGRKTNHPETGSNAARSSGDSERGGGIFVEMRRVSSTRHGTNYVSKFPRFFSLDRFGSALLLPIYETIYNIHYLLAKFFPESYFYA